MIYSKANIKNTILIRLSLNEANEKLVFKRAFAEKKPAAAAAPQKSVDPRRTFRIYKFDGVLSKEAPKLQNYELDVSTCGKMVLDALIKLKDMDPSVTFRRSCREGICGSCAVNLQGMNKLACITQIPPDKTVTIYPLPHMYVIRDLVVDMTHFFNGYNSIKPYLVSFLKGSYFTPLQNV